MVASVLRAWSSWPGLWSINTTLAPLAAWNFGERETEALRTSGNDRDKTDDKQVRPRECPEYSMFPPIQKIGIEALVVIYADI